jgi:hypothetical protein
MRPVARRDGLLIRELPDEVLVYDRESHRAHCLNRSAAVVFRHADGNRTVADLANLLAPRAEPVAGAALVTLALGQLAEAGLLDSAPLSTGPTRRAVIRRVGLGAALLLPVVASIVVPTPAEAAATCVSSCLNKPDGTPCDCSGLANPCTATCQSESCSDAGGC